MDIPITVHNDKKEEDQNENNHSEENPTEGGDGDKHEDHNNNEDNHGHDDNHDNNEPEEKQLGKTGIIAIVVIIILAVVFLIIRSQNAKDLVSGVGDSVRDAVGQEEEKMSESAMLMLDATPGTDTKVIAIQNDWIVNIAGIEFKNSGALTDVAGSTATGIAGSDLIDDIYHLYVAFENLPILEDEFFYEGWVVRKDLLSVMSTGKLVDYNGNLVNAYLSREDLSDHTTYVLTKEPDDGDPAPAEHILEGVISPK